jgi:hypothetical protein
MRLTSKQLQDFGELGYLVIPDCFTEQEIAVLPRKIVYLTLCAVSNHITKFTRPEFIAHRDFTPIKACADSALLDYAERSKVAAE